MTKKKYVIDDRRPSILPKIGSAVIAIGSFATVAAVASPNVLPLIQDQSSAQTDAFGNPIANSTSPDSNSTVVSGEQVQSTGAPNLPTTQLSATSLGELSNQTSNSTTSSSADVTAPSTTSSESTSAAQQISLPSLPSAGNTSSPTPTSGGAGSTSWGNAVSGGSTASGNLSSPTPAGGYAEDDDDDHDDHDDHDDDHDDDHEDHEDD